MKKIIKNTKKLLSRNERGQVLVVVAVSIVAMVAIIGLSLDVGIMFIENARLRRAVDASALAAALQFREGYQMSELDKSAVEFLKLNGINDPFALVQVCQGPDFAHTIPIEKCPQPSEMKRKLVRVVARGSVRLAFLPVIGIDLVPIGAEAISETASVDVVLVLDRSESMTWDAPVPTGDPMTTDIMRDPSICNAAANPDPSYTGFCNPFDKVKKAAVGFVEQLYFPYDRVAVVTFDKNPHVVMHFSNVKADITNHIKALTVYQGEETAGDPTGINAIYPAGLPSRWYDAFNIYWGLQCPQEDPDLQASYPRYPDPAPCPTTNIGSGLYTAGTEFTIPLYVRMNSLWVTILLTDGVANSGYDATGRYFCPDYTWGNSDIPPRCNDGDTNTRHGPMSNTSYDAEDFAYDAADFVANKQNSVIFTIGLGAKVTQLRYPTDPNPPLGETFLKYAAEKVGNGGYAFAPSGAQLAALFKQIADKIATRLEH